MADGRDAGAGSEQSVIARLHAEGRTRFMGLELLVAPGALVPRAETELLARTALRELSSAAAAGGGELRVIDMCCGSGNLAAAIASALPAARVWASDLTDGCVELARRNVSALGLQERVTIVQGDLFAPLGGLGLEGTIDAIVCNPPYISTGKLAGERAELLVHEPREAFDGGAYGINIHQRVIREGADFLRGGGVLLFEMGVGQGRQLAALFGRARTFERLELVPDSTGETRVAVAHRVRA